MFPTNPILFDGPTSISKIILLQTILISKKKYMGNNRIKQAGKWQKKNPFIIEKIASPKGSIFSTFLTGAVDHDAKKLEQSRKRCFHAERDTAKVTDIDSGKISSRK